MLEQMRKGSHHPIAKGLFFVLALSFVVWGVGDVFRNSSSARYVATVGKVSISPAELDNVVRGEVAKYQQMIGKTLSEEEIDKLGIRNYVLGQIIQNKVITLRAADLKLMAGPKIIAKHIYENDVFDEKGKFDKERFKLILRENGFTEAKYLNAIRKDVAVSSLVETITKATMVPDILAREIFKHKNESRVADLIVVPASLISQVSEPSETDLLQYYNDHQESFSVPEQRALTYIRFNIDKVKSGIKFSDEELQSEYQHSLDKYKTEETRSVQQYLFSKEEEAKAAYEKISKGDTKQFAAKLIELGNVTKATLPAELKDAIFSLQKGEVSQPVKSSLGWHIFIVKSIDPEKVKSFSEVKTDIENELLSNKAADEFSKFGNQVEDEFAAGKTMEEVAAKFDFVIHKIPAVDKNGNGANGNKLTDMPDPDILLPVAFNLDAGASSALTLLSDNASYAVVRVDSISQKRIKALDEVKGIAIKMWKDQEKTKKLKEQATEIVTKLRNGEDFGGLVSKMKLKLIADKNIKRPSADLADSKNAEPEMLVNELFLLKKNGAITDAYLNSSGDFVIAKLKNVIIIDPASDKNRYKDLKEQLEEGMRDDIMTQYVTYLRNKYPVSINENLINAK